jgi:hypothetical protein
MKAFAGKPWVRAAILAGIAYFVVGLGSAALDPSVPDGARFLWRQTAWAASATVFAAHLGSEHFRLGDSPRAIALHAAVAVALGAFLLAAAATAHAVIVPSHAAYWRYLLALVLWPAVTALPAFLVALGAGAVLSRLPRRAQPSGIPAWPDNGMHPRPRHERFPESCAGARVMHGVGRSRASPSQRRHSHEQSDTFPHVQ